MADQSQPHPQNPIENEIERKSGFALNHGYTVENVGGFWRVYVPPASPSSKESKSAREVALCLMQHDAVNIAYAMAMLRDRVRLSC